MKRVTILGSAGSIGRQTLDVISRMRDEFSVYGLATLNEVEVLVRQIEDFRPDVVAIGDKSISNELREALRENTPEILSGDEGVIELASRENADIVVNAIVGAAALKPSLAAIRPGTRLCSANKESLVIAGHLIMPRVAEVGAELIPIDSEHSALLQASLAGRYDEIKRLILTASGGPFHGKNIDFETVTVNDALKHPNWAMGAKITVDSATMMNKGLEVIEAHWLFDIPSDRIDVLVHPESIIHSIVEFVDGSQIAQAGLPDMRLPIQYALTYPDRLPGAVPSLNLAEVGQLNFSEPDYRRFPCLLIAYDALDAGGSAPCAMNAANEAAVRLFLEGQISFAEIPRLLNRALTKHAVIPKPTIDDILAINKEVFEETVRSVE
ncbi:1-deoxy-D-xylulose-5-phosphate reductoisomerase [bacterium]|nr:MAG: 1-deoxy-D-xylulose-5-phosphate reductoisomerase [bacterium]